VDDNLDTLDGLVESAFFSDSLSKDERLDLAGVLVAVFTDPAIGLLLLAKRETNRITAVEEKEGDGGADETRSAGDDDGSGLGESGGGRHAEEGWKGG